MFDWVLYYKFVPSAHTVHLGVSYGSQYKGLFFTYPAVTDRILGTFVKLRKPTIRFVMSVCLSVSSSFRMEQLGSHWN